MTAKGTVRNGSGQACRPLTSHEALAIEHNLFPFVRDIVAGQPYFPWHRDKLGLVTASRVFSSQALAVDLFGTIARLVSVDSIVNTWMKALTLNMNGPWLLTLEELVPKALLNEPRSTQIDAVAKGNGGIVLFECKFTEPDGGACSQPQALQRGLHKGLRQCNGSYEHQTNPVNQATSRCALSGKNIRYWDLVAEVINIDPTVDHHPCPFAGGWYQWMRNLVAARALGQHYNRPSAFVVVYADGRHPMAEKVKHAEWRQLLQAVTGRMVPLRAVSYQRLLDLAIAETTGNDQLVLKDLKHWMMRKMEATETQ